METVIDLNHVRRGIRLFRIILKRFGLDFFTIRGGDGHSYLDEDQVHEILDVIVDWLERCTGDCPSGQTLDIIGREVTRILREELNAKNPPSPRSIR